jgi:hypothetical protein
MEETTKSLAEAEIAGFPPWAQVALAARCAQRLYPLMMNVRLDSQGVLADAVEFAARAAAERGKEAPAKVAEAATAADKAIVSANDTLLAASYAARAAGCAIQAVASILGVNPGKTPATKYASEAFGAALRAIGAQRSAQMAILRDLKAVRTALEKNPDAPIGQDVFGPLWPEGPPPGWPSEPASPARK